MNKKFFFPALSNALNAYLELDPESLPRIQKLSGKIIAFELLPFHFKFQCLLTDTGIQLHTDDIQQADTTISGTPLQLLNVAVAPQEQRQRFFAEDVTMSGDAELGQQVIAIFDQLHIDWEEQIAKILGDISAYHISQRLHRFTKQMRASAESFSADINEYVHEEKEWTPTKESLQTFFDDIDHLRMDVDRAAAKIKKLSYSSLEHPAKKTEKKE